MNRLKILIIAFFICLAIPLAFLVLWTQESLEREELAELKYFSEAVFDNIEDELTALVAFEESRSVDDYNFNVNQPSGYPVNHEEFTVVSYIVGYLQSNPDGGFQALPMPGPSDRENVQSLDRLMRFYELSNVNEKFSGKRMESREETTAHHESEQKELRYELAAQENDGRKDADTKAEPEVRKKEKKSILSELEVNFGFDDDKAPASEDAAQTESASKAKGASVADKYFASNKSKKQKVYLGQPKKRVEQITRDQAQNLAMSDRSLAPQVLEKQERLKKDAPAPVAAETNAKPAPAKTAPSSIASRSASAAPTVGAQSTSAKSNAPQAPAPDSLQEFLDQPQTLDVEVAPMQSVPIDEQHIYIFRRIVIDSQIYRQGFVINATAFLSHLVARHFSGQPISEFSNLRLTVASEGGKEAAMISAGVTLHGAPIMALSRVFPRPFSFLSATLASEKAPPSAGRETLDITTFVLGGVLLLGFLAIYLSARVVLEMSERRTGFVSSVTHELKTPLTTIRMYIEMLEQGMFRDTTREQEYYRIVGSESARLSRLINNVLEFSKLERKQRRFDMQNGDFEDVLHECLELMAPKCRLEGYTLNIERSGQADTQFAYDREAMLQVLLNLVENALKFGKEAKRKEITILVERNDRSVRIRVSDHGPGIPKKALKKVFDDFYRVDSSLSRKTEGTGIGLSLVKKYVQGMGGRVQAQNNDGGGCAITMVFPVAKQ